MGGLEGKALQDAFGFAPGSGGFAARTRRKTQTSRGPAAPAPPPGEFASSIIKGTTMSAPQHRVLIADDEIVIGKIISRIIASLGLTPTLVHDGAQAIAAASTYGDLALRPA